MGGIAGNPQGNDDPWRLRDALAGNEIAWRAIVNEFLETIWHWARQCGLTVEQAEDVSQTVWYKLKDVGHTIDDPARLAGWLATVTRREAIAVKRRRDQEQLIGMEHEHLIDHAQNPTRVASPEALLIAADSADRIVAAFRRLSEMCQQLLSLCWPGSLTYDEIATILGRPVGSIGPTRARCLAALRTKAELDD